MNHSGENFNNYPCYSVDDLNQIKPGQVKKIGDVCILATVPRKNEVRKYFQLDINDAQAILGTGGMATVYLGYPIDANTGRVDEENPVVIKLQFIDHLNSKEDIKNIIREFFLTRFCQKTELPILASFNTFRAYQDVNQKCMLTVTEYCPQYDLATFNEKGKLKKLPLLQRFQLIQQIAAEILLFAENTPTTGPPLIHRDLKMQNIMVYKDSQNRIHAHIIDYGLAVRTGEKASVDEIFFDKNVVGTPGFVAPEANTKNYTTQNNIFPLCAIFTFILGGDPLENIDPLIDDYLNRYMPAQQRLDALDKTFTTPYKINLDALDAFPDALFDEYLEFKATTIEFLDYLQQKNPSDRPSPIAIYQFFTAAVKFLFLQNANQKLASLKSDHAIDEQVWRQNLDALEAKKIENLTNQEKNDYELYQQYFLLSALVAPPNDNDAENYFNQMKDILASWQEFNALENIQGGKEGFNKQQKQRYQGLYQKFFNTDPKPAIKADLFRKSYSPDQLLNKTVDKIYNQFYNSKNSNTNNYSGFFKGVGIALLILLNLSAAFFLIFGLCGHFDIPGVIDRTKDALDWLAQHGIIGDGTITANVFQGAIIGGVITIAAEFLTAIIVYGYKKQAQKALDKAEVEKIEEPAYKVTPDRLEAEESSEESSLDDSLAGDMPNPSYPTTPTDLTSKKFQHSEPTVKTVDSNFTNNTSSF